MRGGFCDGQLAFRSRSDFFGDIIRVLAQNCKDLIRKTVVLADLKEIFKSEHNVFSAPDIPSAKFFFYAVGRDSAEAVPSGQHIPHGGFQNAVKRLVLRVGVGEASTAHHFTPILNAPAEIAVVYVSYAELRNEKRPKRRVHQLILLDQSDGVRRLSEVCLRADLGRKEYVGISSVFSCKIFHRLASEYFFFIIASERKDCKEILFPYKIFYRNP